MSKAIYQPTGKAGEYARWACNLYVGCSNDCDYCYCKRGALGTVMGKPQATLKKGFRDESEAFAVFRKELMRYHDRIIAEGGLFFSFSTDPCLPETLSLTVTCVAFATGVDVPCLLLTKRADWILEKTDEWDFLKSVRKMVSIGFTLTGMDGMERGASPTRDRISAMKILHDAGFKTFASVEPVVDFEKAKEVIALTRECCDVYKIGLLSGDRGAYEGLDLQASVLDLMSFTEKTVREGAEVYWKKSIREVIVRPCHP